MTTLITFKRILILSVVALSVSSSVSCGSTQEVGTAGKLELQREELQRLKRDILKVDKSIDVTKELIRRSKGERYLPDLYFRLAELYIEKSRLVYFRILEEAGADDKAAVVAPEARLLKDQAISVYRRILSEFPDYPDNDKIAFFIAHEYRELGNFPEMIKAYEELIQKYPKSNFRYEAWLILGDYHFDKGDIDEAITNYRAILKGAETYAHNMSRYKLAWCYINKDKTNLAVDLWEQAVKTPPTPEPGVEASDALSEKPGRLEVRQEALRDLAYYYAEARDPKGALAFFQDLTVSRQEYRTALERLAKRFQIKTMYEESAKVYRELVRVSADVDRNLEWAESIYEAAVAAKDLAHADEDVIMLAEVSARYKYWWRATDDDKKVLKDFEMLTRDLSTRLHSLAKEKNDAELYARAAKAYESYLSVFDDSPDRLAMEWNYAETLFAAKRFVKAGDRYEEVLALLGDDSKAAPPPKPAAADGAAPPAPVKDAVDPKKDPAKKDAKAEKKDDKKPPPPAAGTSAIAATSGSVDGDKKQAMYSAILAYFEALKVEEKGTRYDSMMAREGIKDLGGRFVTKYPDDANTPNVKFNVARAYFEQGIFDRSIELFTAFVKEYPQNKDAATAAELTLDAFAQKEDFVGLAKAARDFAKEQRLADPAFRERFAKMAEDAEQEEINRKTIQAEGNVQLALKDFIVEKKGSEVAAKALYQAFVIARDRRNLPDMTSTGRQLIEEYSNTKYAKEVLPSLAEQSLRTSQMEQAAAYYEEYARRFPEGEAADDLLDGAAQIRDSLGEYAAAMSDYERLTKQGDDGRKPKWLAKLAETATKAGDWRRAEEAALQIADNGAHAVLGNAVAGEAALRTGKPDVAAERLSAAVAAASRGRGIDDGPEWVGRAQYLMGEIVRNDYERVQFRPGEEGAVLQEKFQLLEELQATYVEAIKAGDPEWAMGGLYRIASATKQAADFLDNAPAPSGISADEEKQYRAALAERAAPLRKQAQEALEQCRAQAKKLDAFNRFTKACVSGTQVQDDADNPRARPPGVAIPGREQMEAKLIENPKDMTTLLQLMRAAIQVKDFPLAKLLAGKALELDEKSAALHNLQGVAYAGANDMQSAAASFKKALRYDPKYPPALANLGTLYALYGDDNKGKDYFGKAGAFDSSSPDVLPQAASARGGGR